MQTIAAKAKAYPNKIPRAMIEDAERVSTYKFTTPVNMFACTQKKMVKIIGYKVFTHEKKQRKKKKYLTHQEK